MKEFVKIAIMMHKLYISFIMRNWDSKTVCTFLDWNCLAYVCWCSLPNSISICAMKYLWSKVNIWNINCARATAFIFDTRTGVPVKCQSFWDRKCLDMRGTRTPNLRIHAECTNLLAKHLLSHVLNTGSGAIFIVKFYQHKYHEISILSAVLVRNK